MTLYSYCITVDAGAAPNPYWDICTLTICKPVIRRVAKVGDWIIAMGSKDSHLGDLSNKVVYIMKVTRKMKLEKYDKYCRHHLPYKIPNIQSRDYRKQVGDCIYDYTKKEAPIQRLGVHNNGNVTVDLGGQYSLLSSHFYYFGNKPITLPLALKGLIKSGQGHKSKSNDELKSKFLNWITEFRYRPNMLYGKPQMKLNFEDIQAVSECAKSICKANKKDEKEYMKGIC